MTVFIRIFKTLTPMDSSRVPGHESDTPEGTAEARSAVLSRDPLAQIHKALARRDQAAIENQRKRLTFARMTALLTPFAVLFLACQIENVPTGSQATGLILIGAELLTLASALAIAFLRLGESHHRWIGERLRAEILRRESFLLLARVGPYLKIPEAALSSRVEQRLLILDNDLDDPVAMLAMNDGPESWRDTLENSHHVGSHTEVLDKALLQHYLHKRVGDQRRWFSKKCLLHEGHAWYFESGAKVILALALIIAAIHFGRLLNSGHTATAIPPEPTPLEPTWARALIVAAIVSPVVGAALVGLLSILGYRRLSVSYAHHADALVRLENELTALEADVLTGNKPSNILDLRFKRLILETEAVLSNELRLWWFFMHPELPGAS